MSDRLEQLKKMHQADPADPFCPYGIALELIKLDKPEEALTWLDRTIELDEAYCYAYFQKAKLLAQADRRPEAREVIQQGLQVAQRVGDQKAQSELSALGETI